MRIVVTGRRGQVARALAERAAASGGIEVVAAARPELDLLDPDSVARTIAELRPDIVVSAAAYTMVDRAEEEPDLAMAVNGAGAGAVAAAAAAAGAPVIHLSTDYVFSGDAQRPYREEDPTGPVSAYGRSKLAGEKMVAAANPRHVILRTAWVYSPFGRNFVGTMLDLARDREEVAVVSDQTGNPTSALDIADGILHIARALQERAGPWGVYHLAGGGETAWNGFAEHIFAVSRILGGPAAAVRSIAGADFPARARRPANSRLDTAKLARVFGWQAPDWRASCETAVRRILGEPRSSG